MSPTTISSADPKTNLMNLVPERYAGARLNADHADAFPQEIRASVVDYVADWPNKLWHGTNLVLLGPDDDTTSRTWLAAAIVNEILQTHAQAFSGTSTAWASTADFARAEEYFNQRRSEQFFGLMRKWEGADLLVVEDVMTATFFRVDRRLRAILSRRYSQKLATLLLGALAPGDDPWEKLAAQLGWGLTKKIRNTSILIA
jgi:DNA replication protein DnaC